MSVTLGAGAGGACLLARGVDSAGDEKAAMAAAYVVYFMIKVGELRSDNQRGY